MPNKELGIADPVYDALRIRSGQSIAPDLGGGSFGTGGVENKIYVWHADGSTIDTFDPDAAGLALALAAAASGDTVWLPSMTIALTSGITVPAGVTVIGIDQSAVLSFSGFSGTGVTLSAGSVLWTLAVLFNGTGYASATAVGSTAAGWVIHTVVTYAHDASASNYGINGAGSGFISNSTGHGKGTDARGIVCGDYVTIGNGCTGFGEGTDATSAGLYLTAAAANPASVEWFQSSGKYGCIVAAGAAAEVRHSSFKGDTTGLVINATGALTVADVAWNSISNAGTLTYRQGSRGNYSVEDYHASDIEAATLTRHLPVPTGSAGDAGKAAVLNAGGTAWEIGSVVSAGVEIDSDDALIVAVNAVEQGSTPSTPGAGHRKIYAKSDGWYDEDDGGVETKIGTGAGSVTSIAAGTGIAATPDPITTTGTIALNAALNDLNDVNTAGEATGDIIYDNAGTWIPYPLGVGSKITVSGTKIRFGNVAGGNYLEIDSVTGTLRLAGDATTYDDFRVEASVVKPGATAPNWKAFGPSGNLQALMFEASHHDEAYFELQMPHTWKLGTNIYPHVHWTPVNTTAGNVVWELEYSWANVGDAFGAPSNMATDATAAGGVAWVHKLTDFKSGGNNYIDGTGKTLSSMLICRLHRNSNAGSDTLNQDVALLEVDFHYQIDSLGSDEPLVKDASASLLLETGDILLLETGDRLLLE